MRHGGKQGPVIPLKRDAKPKALPSARQDALHHGHGDFGHGHHGPQTRQHDVAGKEKRPFAGIGIQHWPANQNTTTTSSDFGKGGSAWQGQTPAARYGQGSGNRQTVLTDQQYIPIGEVLVVQFAQNTIDLRYFQPTILLKRRQYRRQACQHGINLNEGTIDCGFGRTPDLVE